MELLGKGEWEVKGYHATQLAAIRTNLVYTMFQSSSSFFPRRWWQPMLVLPENAMLPPVSAAVKTGDAEEQ